jgi:hypothetical protein
MIDWVLVIWDRLLIALICSLKELCWTTSVCGGVHCFLSFMAETEVSIAPLCYLLASFASYIKTLFAYVLPLVFLKGSNTLK